MHQDNASCGLCLACQDCLDYCQFDALTLQEEIAFVDQTKCVGCGVCVPACPEGALILARRSPEEILPIPATESDWRFQRASARGMDLNNVL